MDFWALINRRVGATEPQQYGGLPQAFGENLRSASGTEVAEFPLR